jgi:hypothetical protein
MIGPQGIGFPDFPLKALKKTLKPIDNPEIYIEDRGSHE